MSLVDDMLPVLDWGRGLLDDFGFRLFTVTCRTVVWTGERVGVGTPTTTDTTLYVDGTKRPKVRELTSKEVINAGGDYSDSMVEVGRFTPGYMLPATLQPATGASPTEVFYRIVGPGYPTTGAWFELVKAEFDRALHYTITLRKTSRLA